jgi:hypothetical protein
VKVYKCRNSYLDFFCSACNCWFACNAAILYSRFLLSKECQLLVLARARHINLAALDPVVALKTDFHVRSRVAAVADGVRNSVCATTSGVLGAV